MKVSFWNSIIFKAGLLMFFIAGTSFIINYVAMFNMGRIINSSKDLITSQNTTNHLSQEAILALENGSMAVNNILELDDSASQSALLTEETHFNDANNQFEMYLTALIWGSQSSAFINSQGGTNLNLWKQMGLDKKFVVSPLPTELAQIAGQMSIFYTSYSKDAESIISLKKTILDPKIVATAKDRANLLRYSSNLRATRLKIITYASDLLNQFSQNSQDQITAQSNESQRIFIQSLIFGFIACLITFNGGLLLLYVLLVSPIKKLAMGIAASDGIYHADDIHTHDEIASLADSFNVMGTKIKESQSLLEQKIVERTKELELVKKNLEINNQQLDKKIQDRTAELEKLKTDLEKIVAERTLSLKAKMKELEETNDLMIGREITMANLKKEIASIKNSSQKS